MVTLLLALLCVAGVGYGNGDALPIVGISPAKVETEQNTRKAQSNTESFHWSCRSATSSRHSHALDRQ